MANIKSQIKRNKTNQKATDRNRAVRSEVRTSVLQAREAIKADTNNKNNSKGQGPRQGNIS